ncbi:MAG: helix-turn-helix transcriptional regulator [Rhodospirillaceae bacterium]|nr:helix-turn-helix transcriptional regulator [Rhodospirillaceae bacterium]
MPGTSFNVLSGDAWLMRTDDHCVGRYTPPNVATEMSAIRFDVERIREALGESGTLQLGAATRLGRNEDFSSSLCGILNNPLASPLDRLLAEGQSLALLARWLGPAPKTVAYASGVSNDDMRRLDRVIEMLTADLTAPPTLDSIATLSEMSHPRLNRCFRKAYGVTVFEWLRGYRLDRARRYLLDPKTTITGVAFRCGFSSSSHFAIAFRERFHCSPMEYRKQTVGSESDDMAFAK